MAKFKRNKKIKRTSPNIIYRLKYSAKYLYLVPTIIDETKSSYVPFRIRNYFLHYMSEKTGNKVPCLYRVFMTDLVWNKKKTAKIPVYERAFQFEYSSEMYAELKLWDQAGKDYLKELEIGSTIEEAKDHIIWLFRDLKLSSRPAAFPYGKPETFEEDCELYSKACKEYTTNYIRAALGAGQ